MIIKEIKKDDLYCEMFQEKEYKNLSSDEEYIMEFGILQTK